jgi:hypothetical protein
VIPNKPAPHLMLGRHRFSEKIMFQQNHTAGRQFGGKIIPLKAPLVGPTPLH